MNSSSGQRVGVVFSGGASYGAYEVGIMKALAGGHSGATSFLPLAPAVLSGASAGAFNAAMLAAGGGVGFPSTVANLERIWLDEISSSPGRCGNGVVRYRSNPLNLVDPACARDPLQPLRQFFSDTRGLVTESVRRGVSFLRSDATFGQRTLDLVDLEVLISGEPYRALVERTVSLAAIRSSSVVLRVSATNWLNGEIRVFGNRDMTDSRGHKIILASSAVPGLFPSVEIDGNPFADGGIVMNTPLRPAIEAGADVIHVISINPELAAMALPRLPSTINTFYRVLAISLAASINRDIEIAARLNDGIAVLEAAKRGVYKQSLPMRALIMTLGGIAARPMQEVPYRSLTIHRHQLGDDFANFLQWLDFDRDRIAWLIEKGTRDAIAHDCAANGCILP